MSTTHQYELQFEDYQASQRLAMKCKRAGKPLRIMYRFFPIFGAVLAATGLLFLLLRITWMPSWWIGLCFGGLYPALFFNSLRRRIEKNAWRTMLSIGHETIPVALQLEDDVLVSIQPGRSESRFLWESILGLLEDDHIALLFITEKQFLFIPKRALVNEVWTEIRGKISRNRSAFQC